MNEYSAIGPAGSQVARAHDPNGNRTDDGTRGLVWDAFNRLVLVVREADAAPIAAYFYLPDGRRSRKVVYSQATPGLVEREVRFVWDGAQEVEEQSAAGATLGTFVWSPVYVDELVEWRREAAHPLGAGSFFAHQDARCDVVAVTNAAGQVVEKRRFADFGREEIRDAGGAVVAGSPSGLEYGFQGRRRDQETGWLYFRARYYSAEEGRFLSRDPVWDAGNVGGWYTFVGNGPASGRDPSGRQGGPAEAMAGVTATAGAISVANPAPGPEDVVAAGVLVIGAVGTAIIYREEIIEGISSGLSSAWQGLRSLSNPYSRPYGYTPSAAPQAGAGAAGPAGGLGTCSPEAAAVVAGSLPVVVEMSRSEKKSIASHVDWLAVHLARLLGESVGGKPPDHQDGRDRNLKHWWGEIKNFVKMISGKGKSPKQLCKILEEQGVTEAQLAELKAALDRAAALMGESPPAWPF